ncbi:MAG: VOC family protein [Microbacterium pygmaeum]
MTVNVTPHLNFRGDARAALEFYQQALGGHIAVVTYQDAGADPAAVSANEIMWGQVASESGIRVMAYDVPAHLPYDQGVNSVFVSVRCTDEAEITSFWNGLSAGAEILQDLGASAWSPLYGMLRDRFGIVWVLDIEVPYSA